MVFIDQQHFLRVLQKQQQQIVQFFLHVNTAALPFRFK